MIIYTKNNDLTNSEIGKLETPLKMIIEHESDLLSKTPDLANLLFNIEKSNRFGETLVTSGEFDIFKYAAEGDGADQDTLSPGKSKFIEHVQFMKEFVISAEMMEDANYGVAADAKRRAENFVRAYYKTINKLCVFALANGDKSSAKFGGANLDLTTADDLPLFHGGHIYKGQYCQSNYYAGEILSEELDDGNRVNSMRILEQTLYKAADVIRNMKDDRGEVLGYTADTIILPGNKPELESAIKKVCGTVNYADNSMNPHYGNWNIIVIPSWQATEDKIMVMSSEANRNLCGNMLFNRVPLTVTNWVDNHTGNYIWNGRCRFGVGFGSYKHIVLLHDTVSIPENATEF